jgi:rod shape-determining protein MreD
MSYSGERLLVSSQREGQVSRFRAWVLFAIPVAAIGFQGYVPLFFPQLKFMDMPLLVVIYFALMRRGQVGGLLLGAAIGLAQDSLSSRSPLGMNGIVDTLVGYFAASVGMKLDVDHTFIRLVLAFFFYGFHQVFYWVMARALLGQQAPLNVQQVLVLGLLNAVIGAALFHFLDRLRERA